MARKPRNIRQVKAEIQGEEFDNREAIESRGVGYFFFRAPGALILWLQYLFPSKGRVLVSARQRGHWFVEVVFSVLFWVAIGIWAFLYFNRS